MGIGAAGEAAHLDGWRAAVGGPVLACPAARRAPAAGAGGLALVSWNLHVGAGALERLVGELRRGELTGGRPVRHFALLLQEAVRVGAAVPSRVAPGAISARAIHATADPARSIEALTSRLGLHGFYAPSMRNGAGHAQDRGNAILSTLPLEDPEAIELPYERQRRVAVSARVRLASRSGGATPLRLVSVHLDNTSRAARFWRSLGAGRARQARELLELLDGDEAIAVGGDLNTWFAGSREEAVSLLRERLPLPPRLPATPTWAPPYGLPQRQLDYLLLRLPAGWRADYRVAPDRRASDHAPLIGWVEGAVDAPAGQAGAARGAGLRLPALPSHPGPGRGGAPHRGRGRRDPGTRVVRSGRGAVVGPTALAPPGCLRWGPKEG
jgi:endonuclease/exonuclease/phosphatase family metal-dependent hydrolase